MYGIGYGYFDSTMLLLIPAILFTLYAQYKVKGETTKYFKVRSNRGMTGQAVARRILDANGLSNVQVYPVKGQLTDHYDPRKRTVSLSENVYYGASISSISIAAHECGHAIQHKLDYIPLNLRKAMVPVVNFSSQLSWIFIFGGLVFSRGTFLLNLGIILFSAAVLFQIVTLPVEFNASSRALTQLTDLGIVDEDELFSSKKVLRAAALTYVAAALSSILQLVRLILISGGRDND